MTSCRNSSPSAAWCLLLTIQEDLELLELHQNIGKGLRKPRLEGKLPYPRSFQDLFPFIVNKEFREIQFFQGYRFITLVGHTSTPTLLYDPGTFTSNTTFLLLPISYLLLAANCFSYPHSWYLMLILTLDTWWWGSVRLKIMSHPLHISSMSI